MIRFECDYAEGSCQEILKKLEETNMEQTPGYGNDIYCESAKEKIKKLCKCQDAEVHFLVGGTQANMTTIASILKSYQGVISADTGHINVHETGAIEATGHKVLVINTKDGKLNAKQVREMYETHQNDVNHEHCVQPGMIYIYILSNREWINLY